MIFMFIMYRGRLAKERYFIAFKNSLIEKIPMLLLSTSYRNSGRTKILKSLVNALFKLTQNPLFFVPSNRVLQLALYGKNRRPFYNHYNIM